MTSEPARTFFVEPDPDLALIEELHVNYWATSLNTVTVDIGLMFHVQAAAFRRAANLTIRICLQTPATDDSVGSLDNAIVDPRVARWLFNDNLKLTSLPAVGTSGPATALEQSDGRTFIVVSNTVAPSVDESTDRYTISLYLSPASNVAFLESIRIAGDRVRLYTRLRYRLQSRAKRGYSFSRGLVKDHMYFDLRFNDARGMPGNVAATAAYVPIDTVRLFLIHRMSCGLSLQPVAAKLYERLLERGNTELDPYFASGSDWRRKSLIHQWKFDAPSGNAVKRGFNALLILDCEKGDYEKVGASVVLLLVAGILLHYFGFETSSEARRSVADALAGLIIVVALGMLADFCIGWAHNE